MRSWKLREMELLNLTEQEQAADIQNDDVAQRAGNEQRPAAARQTSVLRSYMTNMFKMKVL